MALISMVRCISALTLASFLAAGDSFLGLDSTPPIALSGHRTYRHLPSIMADVTPENMHESSVLAPRSGLSASIQCRLRRTYSGIPNLVSVMVLGSPTSLKHWRRDTSMGDLARKGKRRHRVRG